MQCRICGSNRFEFQLETTDLRFRTTSRPFSIERCEGCGVFVTVDGDAPVESAGHYPKVYGAFLDREVPKKTALPAKPSIRGVPYAVTNRRSWLRHVDRSEGRRVLDVGCGNGVHAARLRDSFGWLVEGVEPSAEACAAARRHGLVVHQGTLDGFEASKPFDLVVMLHVLEHVPDPRATIARVVRLLAPGGQLVIAVPNVASLERRAFGAYWDPWDVPRHLHHFGPASLGGLIERCGLVVEHLDYECYTSTARSLANRFLPEVGYHERKTRFRLGWADALLGRALAILRTSSAIQLVARVEDGAP